MKPNGHPNRASTWSMPDRDSEAWRHECEVRYVINLPTAADRRRYLDGVEEQRGKEAADRLRADVMEMWNETRKHIRRNDKHHPRDPRA